MSMLQGKPVSYHLAHGGVWLSFGKLALVAGNIFLNALLARLLAPADLGVYWLVFSLVQFLAIFGLFGLSQAAVRLIAQALGKNDQVKAKSIARLVIQGALLGGLLVSVLLVTGSQWGLNSRLAFLFEGGIETWVASLVIIYMFQTLVAEVYRGFYDIKYATIFGGVSNIALTVVVLMSVWLFLGSSNLKQVLIVMVVTGMCSIALSFIILQGKFKIFSAKKVYVSIEDVFSISWPVWVAGIMTFALTQVDLWIMGVFAAPDEVAKYGAAFRTVIVMTLPLFIVSSMLPPMISELHARHDLERLGKVVRLTATVAVIPAFIMMIALLLWAEGILELLFGYGYGDAGIVLAILGFGHFINIFSGACGLVLMMTGNQHVMMFITVIVGSITIAAGIFLFHAYGAIGVASASCGGMILQNILLLIAVRIRLGLWTHARWVGYKEAKSLLQEVKRVVFAG